ncbi:MAG: hypothetical protein ACK5XV_02630 [Flavobacteriales bacterium]|jgi:DNA-directed RNA polymerase subunit delta
MSLKRIIKDYKTISQEHIDLISRHYPNGFENDNLISFTTPKGEFIKALEIRTDEAIYLFKIDKNMKVDEEESQDNDGLGMGDFDNYKNNDSEDDNEEEQENDESETVADDSDDED